LQTNLSIEEFKKMVQTTADLSEVALWVLKTVCTSPKQSLVLRHDFEVYYQEQRQESPYPYAEAEIRPAIDTLVEKGLVVFASKNGYVTTEYRPTGEGQLIIRKLSEQE
jgi:hypothetical protein